MTQPFDPKLSFTGAVDLSGLGQPSIPEEPQLPAGAVICPVDGGCNLVIMGPRNHETLTDCIDCVVPYVERYLETREAAIEVGQHYHEAVDAYRSVLAANQQLAAENARLQADKDKLAAKLRDAVRGTPAAAEGVLEGAADLAASMKTAFAGGKSG